MWYVEFSGSHGYNWTFSRIGPGQKKARRKKYRPSPTVGPKFSAQAQPVEAVFCRAVGPGLPKILSLGPAHGGYQANISCPGLARLHVLARWVGPFLARVGPSWSGRAAYTQAWSRAKNGRQILLKRPALFGFDLKISVTWLYLLVVVAYKAFCSIMSHKFYTSLGTETAMQACPNCYLI
jgi:hypothetical protein